MYTWREKGVVAVLLLALQSAAYPEIYTWKDKSGITNYSGQPSEHGADKVEARHIPTYKSPDQQRVHQQGRVSEVLEFERRSREQQIAQQNKTREQQKAACARAEKELNSYLQAGYLYEKDDHGNKKILGQEERAQATAAVRREKERLCNEDNQ